MFESRKGRVWVVASTIYPIVSLSIMSSTLGYTIQRLVEAELQKVFLVCILPSMIAMGVLWVSSVPPQKNRAYGWREICHDYQKIVFWSLASLLVAMPIIFQITLVDEYFEAHIPLGRIQGGRWLSPLEAYGPEFMEAPASSRLAAFKVLASRE